MAKLSASDKPKSIIFTLLPFRVTNTLLGFKSRCTICMEWKYAIASSSWSIKRNRTASVGLLSKTHRVSHHSRILQADRHQQQSHQATNQTRAQYSDGQADMSSQIPCGATANKEHPSYIPLSNPSTHTTAHDVSLCTPHYIQSKAIPHRNPHCRTRKYFI